MRRYLERQDGLSEYVPGLLGRVTGWGVMLVGIVLALTALGFDTSGVVLLLALLAVVIALAGKGILENFAAGMLLQIRGPFRTGDRIEVEGYTGTVQEINARTVVIETADRRTVHIPNADVVDGAIVNYTEQPERRSEIEVGIAYDSDVALARAVIEAGVAGVDGVRDAPPPHAFIEEFADSSVNLVVQFWHDDEQRVDVRGRAFEAVKAVLDNAGVEIPFPHRVVSLQNERG